MVFTLSSSKCPPFLVLSLVTSLRNMFRDFACLLKNLAEAGFFATFDANVYNSVNELRLNQGEWSLRKILFFLAL